jgi:AraC-like DNA-binding protein
LTLVEIISIGVSDATIVEGARVTVSSGSPSIAEMITWIEEVVAQGIRRPGYPADRWTEEFIFDKFEEFGLESVRFEPVESSFWKDGPSRLSLRVNDETVEIECFPVPLSEPIRVEGSLAMWNPTEPGTVAGKIAVYELRFGALPTEFPVLPRRAVAASSGSPEELVAAGWAFDPDGTFGEGHRLPFAQELQDTMEPAIAAGAIGFVGVLRGYPSGGCEYYVPYDGRSRPIPGVYVSETEGDRLRKLVEDGAPSASIHVVAERGSTACRNVVGELPGADDEWVILGTHHDAPWASAVEDGSGIALLLAQAAAWAAVSQKDRPHRLIFVATAAHMSAAAGTRAFIERHGSMMDRTVLEIHLEHAAIESPSGNQSLGADTARVTPRWWFTSEIPALEQAVWDAIVEHDLDRSLVLTPDALAPFPTTDGGHFHLAGVPLVNYLAAPWYLFDPADTMDKVDRETLSKVSRAAFDLVQSTANVSAKLMRG